MTETTRFVKFDSIILFEIQRKLAYNGASLAQLVAHQLGTQQPYHPSRCVILIYKPDCGLHSDPFSRGG